MKNDSDAPGPGSVYWAAIEPIWYSISIYDGPEVFLAQSRAVPRQLRHLFACHWCQSEVCNGGFHQFFSNPTGVLAPEACVGYAAIGMPGCAKVIREAMGFFGLPYPRDRNKRHEMLRASPGEDREKHHPFTAMDTRFYDLINSEGGGFFHAADVYAGKIVRE